MVESDATKDPDAVDAAMAEIAEIAEIAEQGYNVLEGVIDLAFGHIDKRSPSSVLFDGGDAGLLWDGA